MKITKDTQIGAAIKENPKSIEVFLKYGLHCIGCPISQMETIEEGARAHGLTDKEIEEMLKEINESKDKKR